MTEERYLRWNYKKCWCPAQSKATQKEGKWLWEGREGIAYLNVKCRAQLRTLVQHTSNAYSRISTYDDSPFKTQQEIQKKKKESNSLILVHPKSQSIFPKSQLIPPHSSHPNLVIRLILDYSDDPEPSPTQFLQQNPLSQIVEEKGPSSVRFLVTSF